MKTALILGGGFAGCTTAHLLREKGWKVTLLEAETNLGGGCWTRQYAGHPYTFGPRIFYTPDEEVWAHMNRLAPIRPFHTKTWTFVERDAQLYHYPLQAGDLPLMPDYSRITKELADRADKAPDVADFETYWQSAVGPTLYEKFVLNYSKKMWGVESNKQLTANWNWVNRGTPIRKGDDRLYEDQKQGYPADPNGYNPYFEKSVKGVDVRTRCFVQSFDARTRTAKTAQGEFTADAIVNTLHTDALLGFVYGRLQWCGRQVLPLWLPIRQALPDDVTWIHYSGEESFTRVTEFKKITGHQSDSTLLGIEIPVAQGRYYPVQSLPELRRFEQYQKLFPERFWSIGRLGSFRYVGIADAIRSAMDTVQQITER